MPPAVSLLEGGRRQVLATACIAVIVILKHHENIRRLVGGTENKFKA